MKIRIRLKQRQTEDVDDPRTNALARMEAAGYFRQASVTATRPQLPANVSPKLRVAFERLQSAGTPPVSDDAVDRIAKNTPDYNSLANYVEKVRRERLGYDDEPFDTFAEDTDADERPMPPTTQRRKPLFPDAPMSWDDV